MLSFIEIDLVTLSAYVDRAFFERIKKQFLELHSFWDKCFAKLSPFCI